MDKIIKHISRKPSVAKQFDETLTCWALMIVGIVEKYFITQKTSKSMNKMHVCEPFVNCACL